MAESFFAAPASAGATSPRVLSLFVTRVVFQSAPSLRYLKRFALPGSPFQSDQFVEPGHPLRGLDRFPL